MGQEHLAQSLGTAQNGGQNARLLAGKLFQKAARGSLAQLGDARHRAPRVSAGGGGLGQDLRAHDPFLILILILISWLFMVEEED
jgi:hypothetical protein